jgi:4-hydroxybenzoyl-CoA reductase subunit beta
MIRLPAFTYRAPKTLAEAAQILAAEGPTAMVLGGGTDLLPNMKRRQQTPRTLVGLRQIEELRQSRSGSGRELGAGLSLHSLVNDKQLDPQKGADRAYAALWQAASQVATPHIQAMGTLGGNLCLDTRCSYYNQSLQWRQAIDFCMKKDGCICWVATSSPKCLAISSSDTAPALIALSARVKLYSQSGLREVPLAALYQNDGMNYLLRRPDEILVSVQLDPMPGWRSTYLKLRRRGSIDFPVLSVAAAVQLDGEKICAARIVLGAVASCPLSADEAAASLLGGRLDDASIEEAARLAARLAHPLDNTDLGGVFRKRVAREFVSRALHSLC